MSTLSLRLPDEQRARIDSMAASRGVSVELLAEEIFSAALAQHEASLRFRALASQGSPKRLAELLDKLDRHFEQQP